MSILFKPIYLKENNGHGNARRISLMNCRNDFIAVMDADDISHNNRFEKQIRQFEENKNIDVVGGQITEFIDSPNNIIYKRIVPEEDEKIKKYLKKHCPMNQMTVMFKRNAVEKAGGYLDWFCNEDYYLWIRMTIAGNKFANLPDTLVNVRIGNEMAVRRGGWKYFKSEAKIQKYMLQNRLISIPQYLYNIMIRFGGEVIIPAKFRSKLFRYMRERYDSEKESLLLKKECLHGMEENKTYNTILKRPAFSVAMCVYEKDNAKWFDEALASVTINQTIKPDEVVLVIDGPISLEIQNVIDKYESILKKCE